MQQSGLTFFWAVACLMGSIANGRAIAACENPDPARIELRMYKYSGAETGEAVNQFSSFYRIVRAKLRLIKEEVSRKDLDVKYLAQLTVKPESTSFDTMERPPNDSGLAATWIHQDRHLLLLYGDMQPVGGVYQVASSLFWGNLGPKEFGSTVTAFMPITQDGSISALDSHSMVTLAALALDAMNRKCDPSVVKHLLGRANYNAMDLERRGQLQGDLVKVHELIEELIRKPMN